MNEKSIKSQKLKMRQDANKLEAEILTLQKFVSDKQREVATKQRELEAMNKAIKELGHFEMPKITDHALVRFIERVCEVNVEEVRARILTDELIDLIQAMPKKEGKVNANGFVYVLQNNTIVTITEK